jgi:hypothetical protein
MMAINGGMYWEQSAAGAKQYFQGPLPPAVLTATQSYSLEGVPLSGDRSFLDIHDGIGRRIRQYRCTNRLTLHEA